MDITPTFKEGVNHITGYDDNLIIVNNNERIETPLLIGEHNIIKLKEKANLNEFCSLPKSTIDLIITQKQSFEILLISTGDKHLPLAQDTKKQLIENNINFEIMNKGACCRTYNVLVSEDRKVVAVM